MKKISLILFLAFLSIHAFTQNTFTTTWDGGGTNNFWTTTANWDNGVPNNFKHAEIPSGYSVFIFV